uniref:Zona pellucida glycoprotein 2 n=1 Tax=Varanus komodoensis TaxID=61221 RepID=A0A8D2KTS2_VARKO
MEIPLGLIQKVLFLAMFLLLGYLNIFHCTCCLRRQVPMFLNFSKQTHNGIISCVWSCFCQQNHKHHLRFRLQFNDTVTSDIQNVTYDVACDALQADEAARRGRFASATNCTKDFMAFRGIPRLGPQPMDLVLFPRPLIEDGTQMRKLSLRQAMQQGYNFLMDDNRVIIQVSFDAAGVASYKQDGQLLYTVALKLTYGSPEQRLTVESRMICAPGPAICNATHMTIAIPDFPGSLSAVSLDNRNIPLSQFEANGIQVDTRKGTSGGHWVSAGTKNECLPVSRQVYNDDYCSGFQLYAPLLKLYFGYHGETATMLIYPECPCEQNAPIAAVCTPDGYMDFEILSSSTKPALNLDLLRLKDPSCKPVFQSPSNDVVRFHVPLNGCGTMQRFDGEKAIYENEVTATWMDLPARWISRDSEFKLTVICYYGSDDAALDIKIGSLSPPDSVVNQGPLSLILLIYPDSSYMVPYSDDQYPIVKYLRQPIFIEVQVLNRVDPNIQLMLDDCWASLSLDPASLPRWNIVVDGCDYEQDNYKTVFHPVDPTVSYYNFRQRFEVKAFAFVSDGKALPSLVYFHCSVLICDRFHPDSPLCSTSCPRRPSRGRRGNKAAFWMSELPDGATRQGLSASVWLILLVRIGGVIEAPGGRGRL